MCADPLSEKRSESFYVPRDEAFSEIKELTFSAKTLHSLLHALMPSLSAAFVDSKLGFPHFMAIDSLFKEGINLPPSKHGLLMDILPRLVRFIGEVEDGLLRFETPQLMESKTLHHRFIFLSYTITTIILTLNPIINLLSY